MQCSSSPPYGVSTQTVTSNDAPPRDHRKSMTHFLFLTSRWTIKVTTNERERILLIDIWHMTEYPVGNQSLGSLDRLTTNRQLQSDVQQANCYLYACSPGLNLQRRTRTTVTNISRWWRGGLANLLERQLNDIVELPQQWFADPGGRAVLIWQQTKISSRRKELNIIYGNTKFE